MCCDPPSVLSGKNEEVYNVILEPVLRYIARKIHPLYRRDKYHVCALFNMKTGKIYLGENKMFDDKSFPLSIHAEMDALAKVPRPRTPRQRQTYDALVIRIGCSGKLGISRPCHHCIKNLQMTENIKVRNVYYSSMSGAIIRERLEDMLDSDRTIMSSGYLYRKTKVHVKGGRNVGNHYVHIPYEMQYRI
jgi:cytidine deaminase